MRRAVIGHDGRLDLGEQAQHAGFTPGTIVDVRLSCSGSLHVTLADPADIIDLHISRLPAGPARAALTRGMTR